MRLIACLIFPCFLFSPSLPAFAAETEFGQFAVDLPPGWDGGEQRGFVSDNDKEYVLTLGRKDDAGDNFLSQVTIFLLPNKPGADARAAARTLAESQGNASEPEQDGVFWRFTGEPRSRTVKGMGTTLVNADQEYLLIIIAQDEQQLGSDAIISSLRGLTPEARRLLGR